MLHSKRFLEGETRGRLHDFVRSWVPPIVRRAGVRLRRRLTKGESQWEMARAGWDTPTRGWNVRSVVDAQARRWADFAASLEGPSPLTAPLETDLGHVVSISGHNGAMAFAYALMVAAHHKDALRVLDWGGGTGQYALLARAVASDVRVDYTVCDLPLICEVGRRLNRHATFLSNGAEAASGRYDLILASSSIWYSRDWQALVADLARLTDDYLFVTRTGFVRNGPTFVTIQRPSDAGYETEYLCWIFNRDEFVAVLVSEGMTLIREFLIDTGPEIDGAPERPVMLGFLFRKRRGSA